MKAYPFFPGIVLFGLNIILFVKFARGTLEIKQTAADWVYSESSPLKALVWVLVAEVQATLLLVFAGRVGEWLDDAYPRSFSWMVLIFPVVVVFVARTFYLMVRRAYLWTKDDKGIEDAL